MRVFVSSTSEDLAPFRDAAADEVNRLGDDWKAIRMEDFGAEGQRGVVDFCQRKVQECDLVLAIIAWRRGGVPGPDKGGDGFRSYTAWELEAADARKPPVPVLTFLANKEWPGYLWEDTDEARVWMKNFRGNLDRVAVFFGPEDKIEGERRPLPLFRALVARELARYRHERQKPPEAPPPAAVRLRPYRKPDTPTEPYPLLLPYRHPDLFAGRDREQAELLRVMSRPIPILGLFSVSGCGKSSLLQAGLRPALAERGVPVALDRDPHEPGLAGRLVGDLLEEGFAPPGDEEFAAFTDLVRSARDLAGTAPVLVLDQFEDLLRLEGGDPARATAGTLLAATTRRQPGLAGPLCRWVLAYREEYHGALVRWLADVLEAARRLGRPGIELLPHDLRGERFQEYFLSPLGTPIPTGDPHRIAAETFLSAIEKPLRQLDSEGSLLFEWSFANGEAARLAEAFAAARLAQPGAPLVPELQVVLSHLLEEARATGATRLALPEDAEELIKEALEKHVGRALSRAFPPGVADARRRRAKTMLALRAIVARGRQDTKGLADGSLAEMLDPGSERVLAELQDSRILVRDAERSRWVLSHDSIATVVERTVDRERSSFIVEIDTDLLDLRRLVDLNTEYFSRGEQLQSVSIDDRQYAAIQRELALLIRTEASREWWRACKRYRIIKPLLQLDTALANDDLLSLSDEELARRQWEQGDPEATLESIWEDKGPESCALEVLALVWAAGGLPSDRPPSLEYLGTSFWMLDYLEQALKKLGDESTIVLLMEARGRQLRALRALRPLSTDHAGALELASRSIRGGRFRMGSKEHTDEGPPHSVEIAPFRLQATPVTNENLRQFDAGWEFPEGEARWPAVRMTWWLAYSYAAWAGGRLPTEAEWEYACRAGSDKRFWAGDTDEHLAAIGWYAENADQAHETGLKDANPWGLHDVHGNVWEWVADWYDRATYADRAHKLGKDQAVDNPWGPPAGEDKVARGGSFANNASSARSSARLRWKPGMTSASLGCRVWLPAAASG